MFQHRWASLSSGGLEAEREMARGIISVGGGRRIIHGCPIKNEGMGGNRKRQTIGKESFRKHKGVAP